MLRRAGQTGSPCVFVEDVLRAKPVWILGNYATFSFLDG